MTSKDKDLPILVEKADKRFRISAQPVDALDGSKSKLTLQHAVGRGRAITIVEGMAHLGLRDQYLKKVAELTKKWKGDKDGFDVEDAIWQKHFRSRARGAFNRVVDEWKEFYRTQDLEPCATWISTGDKVKGSVFSLWAMIRISSRKLAVGRDTDYAKYQWVIKKSTQSAHDKNIEITRDIQEYLRMGHASKDVQHFLTGLLKGDIPSEAPPALGFDEKK